MYKNNPSLRAELLRARENARIQGGDKLAYWNSLHLNRGTPEVAGRDRIVDISTWKEYVVTQEPPLTKGPLCIGIDLGSSTSMTAAALYWPEVGLLHTIGAFPSIAPLDVRGAKDGVGTRYERMHRLHDTVVYPGRVTPVAPFIMQLQRIASGHQVIRVIADRFRRAECEQALAEAVVGVVLCEKGTKDNPRLAEKEADEVEPGMWPVLYRPVGAGPDGAMDVRAFQGEVYEAHLRMAPNLMMDSAVAESVVEYVNGNPRLEKARQKSRIDALQAAVLAVGESRRWRKPDLKEGLEPFDVGRFAWGAA